MNKIYILQEYIKTPTNSHLRNIGAVTRFSVVEKWVHELSGFYQQIALDDPELLNRIAKTETKNDGQ